MSAEVIVFWTSNLIIMEQSIHCLNVFHNPKGEANWIDANFQVTKVDTTSVETQPFAPFNPHFEALLPTFLQAIGKAFVPPLIQVRVLKVQRGFEYIPSGAESGQIHSFSRA